MNAQHIESYSLFKEDLGTGGRGGYLDGRTRDIIQNHLLQAFMWLAMEPASMTGEAITACKVELPRLHLELDPSYVFLGQFGNAHL